MELVYLWVEKYKNIEKQGFNFSPRFRCEYNEGTNELEIIDKEETGEDYPKNFFDDNINITAIVGENGSGKSSLIQELLTSEELYCSVVDDVIKNTLWVYDNENNQVRELMKDDLSWYNDIIVYNEDKNSELFKNKYNINTYLEKLNIFDNYKANNIAISFLSHSNILSSLNEFSFLPTDIELNLIQSIHKNELNGILGYRFMIDDDMNDTQHPVVIDNSEINKLIDRLQKELDATIAYYNSTGDIKGYMYIREFIYKLNKKDSDTISIFEKIAERNYFIGGDFVAKLENELYNQEREIVFKEIIEILNNLHATNNQIIINIDDKSITKLLSNIHRGFFSIKFFKTKGHIEKIYFNDLSTGEQQILILFAKIFYIIRKAFSKSTKPILLFLDEPDSYLHPNWQKKLLFNIIKMIKLDSILKNKKINIIITSHSPFILSDLPKENVIFLKDGKQVDVDIETFGANIHTLLSHGFFMENGLMGEFAKDKIDKIIKNLKDKDYNPYKEEKEKMLSTIKIIGEEFLRTKLLDMYYKKFNDTFIKEQRKKDLLKQQEKIKKELENL